jgi:hypothetical protein
MPSIRFTLVTADNCAMTKTFSQDAFGNVTSSAIAHMTAGNAKVIEIDGPEQLAAFLPLLKPNQAITCGVPQVGDTLLTTRAGAEFNPTAVARTNEAFRYLDAPALMPIDIDTATGMYRSVGEVLDALEAASPWLRHVYRVARPSSSSYVAGRGLRGVHVYVPVSRGTDIPELGKRLQIEQWATGRGSIVISKSGALLVRQLSDALVYQPSRLMFEAAPQLEGDVQRVVPPAESWLERAAVMGQGRPAKFKTAEGWLDAQELPPLRDIERRRFEVNVRQAKDRMRVEAKQVALNYHKANALAAGLDDGDRRGAQALRALGDKRLPPSWPLALAGSPLPVPAGAIIGNLPTYLGRFCADPFDALRPDLTESHKTKAEIVAMHGKPGVWSHKLQEFFEFSMDGEPELSTPLDIAAENLCGVIEEWPDKKDKKRNSLSNVIFAVGLLAKQADIRLTFDVCLDAFSRDEVPSDGEWLRAVTRLGCSCVSAGTLREALEELARANPVDPWKDAVLSLPLWDGKPRVDSLFVDTFGAVPCEAQSYAARAVLAGLVMRQLLPGAPAPVVPVLIGPQGHGKGLFIAEMAKAMGFPPPTELAFTDDRRMSMAAARAPLDELCEMAGLGKRDAEDVKRWTTDTQDVYRRPYDKKEETHPRRFVLIGTANKNELNRDETGNRRFMPVLTLQSPSSDWSVEVPQLFAEAKAKYCTDMASYFRLIREAAEAVFEYNMDAMSRGEGMPVSDLDDLLPPHLERLMSDKHRVQSSAIRVALDVQATGRKFSAHEVSRWLKARGWTAGADSRGMRYYTAPQTFIDMCETLVQTAPNPFANHTAENLHHVAA